MEAEEEKAVKGNGVETPVVVADAEETLNKLGKVLSPIPPNRLPDKALLLLLVVAEVGGAPLLGLVVVGGARDTPTPGAPVVLTTAEVAGTLWSRFTPIVPPPPKSAESAAFTLGTEAEEVPERDPKPPPPGSALPPLAPGPMRLRLSWPVVFLSSPCIPTEGPAGGWKVVSWGKEPCRMAEPSPPLLG